jgi:16S rRNA (cytosine967-C5)-methyltransferase
VLVYSTCSLETEENEMLADRLAAELPGARINDKKSLLPFRDNCDGAFCARIMTQSR